VPDRQYDVVLYGAGGFTGRQTVAYFVRHAPAGLRWAIAGRRRETLEHARHRAGARLQSDELLVADSADQAAVDAVVSRTRVVLSTAGPFALYGTPIVDACVRFKTHYVDITGETSWVRELIARYHDRTAADGTRIIPFCGFDSVPSDLGTYLLVQQMRHALGSPCAEVHGYVQLRGGLNGGTVASMLNLMKQPRDAGGNDAFLLDPPVPHSQEQVRRSRGVRRPRFDRLAGSWIGPFVMAAVNTRVVRRSAALHAQWQEPYGPDFVYKEAMLYPPPAGRLKAYAATAGLGALLAGVQNRVTRPLVTAWLPKPGEGPSERTMNDGWFRCDLIGRTPDGRIARAVMEHRGDPGNRATVRFVCESALALAVDAPALPGGAGRGGVLTPATGLGEVLARRLSQAGVTLAARVE
jgi:short subunit dehydrogenase-like uncharacterized protein